MITSQRIYGTGISHNDVPGTDGGMAPIYPADPDARRASTMRVPLVRTGARPRSKIVNLWAAQKLQDEARQTHGDRTVQTDDAYSVGDLFRIGDQWWTIERICRFCPIPLVALNPVRCVSDGDARTPPAWRFPCPHKQRGSRG